MSRRWREDLVRAIGGFLRSFRARSTEHLEFELREEENVFALLTLGALAGLPSAPTGISLRLAPHLARELTVMLRRAGARDEAGGEMLGLLG